MSVKTHKGLSKRLKRTAGGKLRRLHSGKRHLMSHKSANRVRRLSGWTDLADVDSRRLQRQYGKIH